MKLRSIELVLPQASAAAQFMRDIWGLADAGLHGATHYLRGFGPLPYLLALEEGPDPGVRHVTFVCSEAELQRVALSAPSAGATITPTRSTDLGGGAGLIVELSEGERFRLLAGSAEVAPIEGADLPRQLTHVVLNARDAEGSATATERALGFRVSDRTRGMVFVRCNTSHHSTAFARAGFSSLNHIAFEMRDIDAVMRGIGRLRDHQIAPSWGPGRHGPGNNVFAYFVAPFGAVVEFSTAVDQVPATYPVGTPDDWQWPPQRIDRWGISDKDVETLRRAEERFRFQRPEADRRT